MRKFALLILSLTAVCCIVKAQFTETYFSDVEAKGNTIIDYVDTDLYGAYIGGKAFYNGRYNTFIAKIDSNGKSLWNTAEHDTTIGYNVFNFIKASDGYLYVCVGINTSSKRIFEMWRVDGNTGAVIWKKPFTAYSQPFAGHIIEYDANTIIVAYTLSYNGSRYWENLAFIDKNTGNTQSTKKLMECLNSKSRYVLALDTDKSIYYTCEDSVLKRNGQNFDSIEWRKYYGGGSSGGTGSRFDYFTRCHLDTGGFYVMGTSSTSVLWGRAARVDKNTGNEVWNCRYDVITDVTASDFINKNGFLYVAWQHVYVGGGYYYYSISKINKQTGIAAWDSNNKMAGTGTGANAYGAQGPLSVAVDSKGDVYATGYYGDDNYGPENWGVMKIDGITGNKIYEGTCADTLAVDSKESVGLKVWLVNDVPHYIGNIERRSGRYKEYPDVVGALFRSNPATGNFTYKNYFTGNYQFPSRTVSIKRSGNNTVILKQVGRAVEVALYDSTATLKWNKVIYKEYYLSADLLAVNDTGRIIIAARSFSMSDSVPFYNTYLDSMCIFVLNSAGVISDKGATAVSGTTTYPKEFAADGNDILLFYRQADKLYFTKLENGVLLTPKNLSFKYYNQFVPGTKTMCDNADSTITVFAQRNLERKVIILNKRTHTWSDSTFIPKAIFNINYVLKANNGNYILAGSDSFNREALVCINNINFDTVWTRNYSSGDILKYVFNPSQSSIYTIGYLYGANNSQLITINKINTADGALGWSYTYANPDTGKDAATDIVYDTAKQQIIVSGYVNHTIGSSNYYQAYVLMLDTTGVVSDSFFKAGEFAGNCGAYCAAQLPDGRIWIGGNMNRQLEGKAGFIYAFNELVITTDIKRDNDLSAVVNCYPNPFTGKCMVNINTAEAGSNVRLEVFDFVGRVIYAKTDKRNLAGPYTYQVEVPGAAGLYFLKAEVNGKEYLQKLVKAE